MISSSTTFVSDAGIDGLDGATPLERFVNRMMRVMTWVKDEILAKCPTATVVDSNLTTTVGGEYRYYDIQFGDCPNQLRLCWVYTTNFSYNLPLYFAPMSVDKTRYFVYYALYPTPTNCPNTDVYPSSGTFAIKLTIISRDDELVVFFDSGVGTVRHRVAKFAMLKVVNEDKTETSHMGSEYPGTSSYPGGLYLIESDIAFYNTAAIIFPYYPDFRNYDSSDYVHTTNTPITRVTSSSTPVLLPKTLKSVYSVGAAGLAHGQVYSLDGIGDILFSTQDSTSYNRPLAYLI